MAQIEIIEKTLPALRLAARNAVVAEQPEVPGVVGPLFNAVAALLSLAGFDWVTELQQPAARA